MQEKVVDCLTISYGAPSTPGCMESAACNYDADATEDDVLYVSDGGEENCSGL